MPPLEGSSKASPRALGATFTRASAIEAALAPRPHQGLHLAVLALLPALIGVRALPSHAQTTVGDRYSGEVYPQPAYRQAAPSTEPTLTWPGKTAATPQLAAPPPASSSASLGSQMRSPAYGYAAQAYRPAAPAAYQTPVTQTPARQAQVYQTPAYHTPTYPPQGAQASATPARAYGAPPVMPWYQRYGGDAASTAAPPLPAPQPSTPQAGAPQSIYDPPAGQVGAATGASTTGSPALMGPPAPAATAANGGETARYYSLHRQYGLTPDPDPIPPQFFTQTADLSDPPGPSAVYKAAANSGGATTAVHVVQSDNSTSTLGQP